MQTNDPAQCFRMNMLKGDGVSRQGQEPWGNA